MEINELSYTNIRNTINPIMRSTGLDESPAFLIWYLQNIYRLDEIDSRDAICDKPNDKGIDGIYINHNSAEIHFFQSKLRQGSGRVGDTKPKEFMGSVSQFLTKENVDSILQSNAAAELKKLITRLDLGNWVQKGYKIIGIYITNEDHNLDSEQYENITENLTIYDRRKIAESFVDLNSDLEPKDEFTFDTDYVTPMHMEIGSTDDRIIDMYIFPAKALQLTHMEGISDGSVFERNVRFSLGNTAVNKSIRSTIMDKGNHHNFPLFHNGITILCNSVDTSQDDKLTITDYHVVNGAQSLTSFYNNKSKLTESLRVILKIIVLQDEDLANKITEYSNNQNAVRPRDLRSNHLIMRRLSSEISRDYPGLYNFEIKRGKPQSSEAETISNESSAQALISFDLHEPWMTHQVSKLFDERYSEIFGRPEVDADRIVFLHKLDILVQDVINDNISERAISSYKLTKYFFLYTLSLIIHSEEISKVFISEKKYLNQYDLDIFFEISKEILETLCVEFEYLISEPEDEDSVETQDFDYKTDLKNSSKSRSLAKKMMKGYQKDRKRNKVKSYLDLQWELSPNLQN